MLLKSHISFADSRKIPPLNSKLRIMTKKQKTNHLKHIYLKRWGVSCLPSFFRYRFCSPSSSSSFPFSSSVEYCDDKISYTSSPTSPLWWTWGWTLILDMQPEYQSSLKNVDIVRTSHISTQEFSTTKSLLRIGLTVSTRNLHQNFYIYIKKGIKKDMNDVVY